MESNISYSSINNTDLSLSLWSSEFENEEVDSVTSDSWLTVISALNINILKS